MYQKISLASSKSSKGQNQRLLLTCPTLIKGETQRPGAENALLCQTRQLASSFQGMNCVAGTDVKEGQAVAKELFGAIPEKRGWGTGWGIPQRPCKTPDAGVLHLKGTVKCVEKTDT